MELASLLASYSRPWVACEAIGEEWTDLEEGGRSW
jgi:hypothetical protein